MSSLLHSLWSEPLLILYCVSRQLQINLNDFYDSEQHKSHPDNHTFLKPCMWPQRKSRNGKLQVGTRPTDTSVADYRKITALLPQISGKPHTCSDCRVELQIFHVCVLTSLAKAHKFVLDVVIATLYKCLAEDKSSSLFGIKQWRGTSNHPENLMNRVRLISTRGLAAVPQPLQLILFCKAHLWIYLLCSVLRFYITGTYGMCDISFFLV